MLDALRRHCRDRQETPARHNDVHEQHGAPRARRAGAARRRDQGLVRHRVDTLAREGVALPPTERLLDRVHRIVQPHALGDGDWPGVERPSLGCSQPRRRGEDGRRLRVLLGKRRLRSLRSLKSSASARRWARRADLRGEPGRDRTPPVPGTTARANRTGAVARGRHRNLLVAATGTGKTVMAAVDYATPPRTPASRPAALRRAPRRDPRPESPTFRHALRDASFGEFWVGGKRPSRFEHVFASIQSLNRSGLDVASIPRTSTSSSSTSSITPPHPRTKRSSNG